MKNLLLTVFVSMFSILASNAEGVAGKWKTSVETPQGDMEIIYDFKVSGEELTGSMNISVMGDVEISKGKTDGTALSFEIDMMGMAMKYEGKLEGEVIKLKVEMPEGMGQGGDPGESILTRVE